MDELSALKCLRCGHAWVPRVANPQKCPKCLSPLWNIPRKVNSGLNKVLTGKMAANAEARVTRVASNEEHRSQRRNYTRKNYTRINGKLEKTPGKRTHPGACELCGRKLTLQYHHWDDSLPSMGLWLCPPHHQFAEGVDHNLVDKYLEIKRQVEKEFIAPGGRTGSTENKDVNEKGE